MDYLPTQPIEPLPGWPLGVRDIIQERVEFEDRILHRNAPVDPIPASARQAAPKREWSVASAWVFGRGVIRFAHSVMP